MASYAAVVSLRQTLERITQDPNHLHQKLEIQTLLEHATILQDLIQKLPRNYGVFEARIRDSAYEAEDIIDNYISNASLSGQGESTFDLKPVAMKLETILEELIGDLNEKLPMVPLASTSSASQIRGGGKDIVVGIEGYAMKIKQQLLGKSSSPLEIISIVGMGGIGKTTLAKTVYEDKSIWGYFDIRVWITVSQEYDPRAALLSLLESSEEDNQEFSNEQLAIRVHQRLYKRRYLVILDDVWNAAVWDDINKLLPKDCNGSRIVITTRQTDVATYADSYIHDVPLMDESTSWYLAEKKVFGERDKCPFELVDLGKTIVRKCRGLPLAISVIAGLLQVSQTQASWNDIANDVNSAISTNDERDVFGMLSLSYSYLPAWLKPCFLYLGVFPEDYRIPLQVLIRLWVGEGFLKPRGPKHLEDNVYECLEDLVKRNLVSEIRLDYYHERVFSVHDVLRELCIKQSKEEKFLYHVSNRYQEIVCNPRRISISPHDPHLLKNILWSATRTALCFGDNSGLRDYKLLRVFDVSLDVTSFVKVVGEEEGYLFSLPQIWELIHLRYLALTTTHYFGQNLKIPADMYNLMNLQTLMIKVSGDQVLFASGIWRLRKLRHLIVIGAWQGFVLVDPSDEETAHPLIDLQTLSLMNISTNRGRIFEMIPNVRKLELMSSTESIPDHYMRDLVLFHHLEDLDLHIKYTSISPDWEWDNHIAFPVSLRKLVLAHVGFPWEHVGTLLGTLPNLEVLYLGIGACLGPVWETREGDFPKLKILQVQSWGLRIWTMESTSHFPCLEHLFLIECTALDELPCLEEMETLQVIELRGVRENVYQWAKDIDEQQRDMGNECFRVN